MTARTFTFDKIDFNGTGRRINLPSVELELTYDSKGRPCVSVCAEVWNSKHTDVIIAGQCLDTMIKFKSLASNPLFCKLYKIHEAYHLNDLKGGGPLQEVALKDCKFSSYEDRCSYLEEKGLLYEDGIKYGAQWWYHKIPEDDLKEIESLLEN